MNELHVKIINIEQHYYGPNKTLLAFVTDTEIDAGGGCMEPIILNKIVINSEVSKYMKLMLKEIKLELICKDFLLL